MSSWEQRKSGLVIRRQKFHERMLLHIPYPGGVVTGNFLGSSSVLNAGSSATFSSFNLGTPTANRSIIVVVVGFSISPPSGCLLLGTINATSVASANNAGAFSQIYIAPVPNNVSSGNITINGANGMSLLMSAYAIYGNSSQTPADHNVSLSNPGTATLVSPGGSFAVAGMVSLNTPGGGTSWSGLSADVIALLGTNTRVSTASLSIPTSVSLGISCSQPSGTSPAFATAVWGP